MVVYYEQLPLNSNRVEIADAVQAVIMALRDDLTIPEIVSNVLRQKPHSGITLNHVKMFLRRAPGSRINESNKTLKVLYDFIKLHMFQPGGLTGKAMTVAHEHIHILEPGYRVQDSKYMTDLLAGSVGRIIGNWLRIEENVIPNFAKKIAGDYILLRKSSEFSDIVLKSDVKIEYEKSNNTVMIYHHFVDRDRRARRSSGIMIPVRDNVYSLCTIEDNQAMEMFAFSVPMKKDAEIDRMNGFTFTTDLVRVIISARVVLDRSSEYWRQMPDRFDVSILRDGKNNHAAVLSERLDTAKSATIIR